MNNHFVKLNSQHGIVIRKAALSEKSVSMQEVLKNMEADTPFESDTLISFGPHFGKDAANAFATRLEAIGLEYIDDFFFFEGDFPDWCQFFAKLN